MKKLLCITICVMLACAFAGCLGKAEIKPYQEMEIIIASDEGVMCKTTRDIKDIEEVFSCFSSLGKKPRHEKIKGWEIMVKVTVDGESFIYSLSNSVFTDSNGVQYEVKADSQIAKIKEIYARIDAEPKDYTHNEKNT